MKATVKLLFLLTISAVCCMLFSLSAFAKIYTGTKENYSWAVDLNTSSMTVSGNGGINDFLNHEQVPYAKFLPLIKTLTIEDGITGIGKNAFMYASSLESVQLPDSVTYIGTSAFEYCINLRQINLPSSILSIEDSAFSSCQALDGIILPEFLESLGAYAFCDCTGLKEIKLPSKITEIYAGTFSGCSSLTSVSGLEHVTLIEEAAFYNCENLDFKTFSHSAAIAARAFFGCTSLNTTIPDSAYSADGAFFNTNVLFNVKWNIGTKTETSKVSVGQTPFYDGTPAKDCVLDGIYLFHSWNKPFAAATSTENEYTALFSLAKPVVAASYSVSSGNVSVSAELDLSAIAPENAYILFACYDENSGLISSTRVAVTKSDTSACAELSLRGRTLSCVKVFIYTDENCLTPLGESVTAVNL